MSVFSLRLAREQAGLSVEQVAAVIKFTPKQIVALESQQWVDLPQGAILKGMLRAYCRAIKVDEIHALSSLPVELHHVPPVMEPPRVSEAKFKPHPNLFKEPDNAFQFGSGRWMSSRGWRVGIFVIGLIALVMVCQPQIKKIRAMWSSKPWVSVEHQSDKNKSDAAVKSVVQATAKPVVAAASTSETNASSSVVAPSLIETTQNNTLHLSFKGSAFVEVRQFDGLVLLSQNNPANTEQVITGRPPFQILIKNPAQVTLIYRQRIVNLQPWISNNQAQFTLKEEM
jgi:cytoskeleton protein RodZ